MAVALGEDAPPLSCCSRNPAEHCSGLQKGSPENSRLCWCCYCNFCLFVLNLYFVLWMYKKEKKEKIIIEKEMCVCVCVFFMYFIESKGKMNLIF